MGPEVKVSRSLPPLVEGKVHGYLKLIVDEVVWSRRSPGDVAVLASWWGELDSAQFRPIDIKTGVVKPDEDTSETYAIRTNIKLFEEYLKNCETIELVVISVNTHQIIGTAHVTDLLDVFEGKSFSRYFTIFNDSGNRLGDIHVGIEILNMTRTAKTIRKIRQFRKTQFDNDVSYPVTETKSTSGERLSRKLNKYPLDYNSSDPTVIKNAKHKENTYKSVLKEKTIRFEDPMMKSNMKVTDKLVAQVVARAQRLRGAILKETREDDSLALSESSAMESSSLDALAENEAKLYEYFLGKEMSHADEQRALETLKSNSPTPSLIDLASDTIHSCHNNKHFDEQKGRMRKPEHVTEESFSTESSIYTKSKESSPLDHVDGMRIHVESLTLSPAGYRRVRSSCVSRGDGVPLSVTYFVEYDTMFRSIKKSSNKLSNDYKATKLCSKKQVGQVIYFNHQAIYNMPKSCTHMDSPLKFKIFYRHLNQRTPVELGVGAIYIGDVVETEYLSSTQKLAIVNKGIKIGELKITVELGCDGIHFGRNFIDAVTSEKENVPVYDLSSSASMARYKTATGSQSKSNSRVSSASVMHTRHNNSESNTSVSSRNDVSEQRQRRIEDRSVRIETPKDNSKEKVLLHGLIYIAEGKDLPRSNSYLICRAFWKEDRACSQLCSNTENPFYHFHELVPLLHGPDLLERTKDNYIVTEVWSRSPMGQDSLLGISKLPVHQLYVAYRDPLVVPHLLLAKYPVISVDGWVPISDPVTGQSCGQLLALVALGTADQIALLEMTRGLRDCAVTPRSIQNCYHSPFRNVNMNKNITLSTQETVILGAKQDDCSEPQSSIPFSQETDCLTVTERETTVKNMNSQESQTDITTVEEVECSNVLPKQTRLNEALGSQNSVLHALVDHLAQALNVPKPNANPTVETQTTQPGNVKITDIIEHIDLDPLSSNSISSLESSPRDNFQIPIEIYRSVGVGAEFEEPVNQVPATRYTNSSSKSPANLKRVQNEWLETTATPRYDNDENSFRAHVDIECALHLPKVEKQEGAVEPCTYVTFQPVQKVTGSQFGLYIVTNVFPNSCSPKWEWRCETWLSTDLLVNDQKRMILKIWRISDPHNSMNADLDKDIVIGFAAVDLSILPAGFPLVSGWFHIMDFTGKCNGQIKVSITPLENISSFVKSTSTSLTRIPVPALTATGLIPQIKSFGAPSFVAPSEPLPQDNVALDTEGIGIASCSQLENDLMVDMGLGFEDVPMTFLSQSLKQKLTELDEITKRLQSRLHDVTNEDFDVDFDPDFDPNEPEPELGVNLNGNSGNEHSINVVPQNVENWQPLPPATINPLCHGSQINGNINPIVLNEIQNQYGPHMFNNSRITGSIPNITDTGYSTNSNVQSGKNLTNGHLEAEISNYNGHHFNNERLRDNVMEQPARGTRMHINHLLDKLTSLTTAPPPPTGNFPMKQNIHDFIASLRQNNIHNGVKCNQEVNARTVPIQTDYQDVQSNQEVENQTLAALNLESMNEMNSANENNNVTNVSVNLQQRNKVSTLIREELIAEENNAATEFDELSTHLLTSNVRHMDLDSILNPLLYQHLIPDVQITSSTSAVHDTFQDLENLNTTANGHTIEELDNRYAETFNTTINNGISRLRSLVELDASLMSKNRNQCGIQRDLLQSPDSAESFRLTPSGVSENIDGNIDITVVHKPNNDDLMASNSTESTTTISMDKSSYKQNRTEADDTISMMSSDSSVSVVSRQAPDGGNPIEETNKPTIIIRQIQDSSSDN